MRRWTTQELGLSDDEETLQAVSLDGKTLCGTLRAFAPAVHLYPGGGHISLKVRRGERNRHHVTVFAQRTGTE